MLQIRQAFNNNLRQITRNFSRLSAFQSSPLISNTFYPILLETPDKDNVHTKRKNVLFQHNLNIDITPRWNPLIPNKEIIDVPILKRIIIDPKSIHEITHVPVNNRVLELPKSNNINNDEGIQAARLIVIRRRKMKKHKLKKLRKKMKFAWAKVRQRREMRKEKAFQAILLSQIKDAEKFTAENYVAEKLRLATENPLPRFWKGKRLPQFLIKQKLGIQ